MKFTKMQVPATTMFTSIALNMLCRSIPPSSLARSLTGITALEATG